MKKVLIVTLMCGSVAACKSTTEGSRTHAGGSKDASKLSMSRVDNTVSGTAGSAWTTADIKDNAFGAICENPGEKVTNFASSPNEDGGFDFTATCA